MAVMKMVAATLFLGISTVMNALTMVVLFFLGKSANTSKALV